MVATDIAIIVDRLSRLARADGDGFSRLAGIAANSAAASASRAELERSLLGAAARHTVAASATSLLGPYLKSGRADDRLMREAVEAALRLNAGKDPRHVPLESAEGFAGWSTDDAGRLTRTSSSGRRYVVAHDPAKPAGDWTLSVDGLPVDYASTAGELAADSAFEVELFMRARHDFRPIAPSRVVAT